MIKEFNSLKDIQKYYDKDKGIYEFIENGSYISVVKFNFDLEVSTNIVACEIIACKIKAHDIYANDIISEEIIANDIHAHAINAIDIKANNISYYGVCFAYNSIKCKSIEGRRHNSKHFVLDGELEVEEDE